MECIECGKQNPYEAAYCPFCGAEIQEPTERPPGAVRWLGDKRLWLIGVSVAIPIALAIAWGVGRLRPREASTASPPPTQVPLPGPDAHQAMIDALNVQLRDDMARWMEEGLSYDGASKSAWRLYREEFRAAGLSEEEMVCPSEAELVVVGGCPDAAPERLSEGWSAIPSYIRKSREEMYDLLGEPHETNENPTTPTWSYWKGEEKLCITFNCIVTRDLLSGEVTEHPMLVQEVHYQPTPSAITIRQTMTKDLIDKIPEHRAVFHTDSGAGSDVAITWASGNTLYLIACRTGLLATHRTRYFDRDMGLHRWRYEIDDRLVDEWVDAQVTRYEQRQSYEWSDTRPNQAMGRSCKGEDRGWRIYH